MSLDKFGRYSLSVNDANLRRNILKAVGISLEQDKQINCHWKRVKNLGRPVELTDAATLGFTLEKLSDIEKKLNLSISVFKRSIMIDIESLFPTIKQYLDEKINGLLLILDQKIEKRMLKKSTLIVSDPKFQYH